MDILEKVYLKLRPWIKNHPNINVMEDKEVCPYCGGKHLTLIEGSYNTQHYKYPVYKCEDCGAVVRSKERISMKKEITSI